MTSVTIVDFGAGNMASVCRALRHVGADVEIAVDASTVKRARRLIVPGVGAFADAMVALQRAGLVDAIRRVAGWGVPTLGICVGMQILYEESEEFGFHSGLGLLRGRVCAIPSVALDGRVQKVPHIGWSEIESCRPWNGTIFETTTPKTSVYFLHSFAAEIGDPETALARCTYGGWPIVAAVQRENLYGCQFHPEKSGLAGLKVLKSFIDL